MSVRNENASFIKTCYFFNDRDEVIVEFPSNKNLHAHVIAMIISAILCVPTVFLNAFTFIAIWRSRLGKEKVSKFTVLVKSAIDLAVGMLIIPLYVTTLASEITGNPSCITFLISKKLGVLVYMYSVTAMSAMNFERYMAIIYPLIHRARIRNTSLLTYTIAVCCFETIFLVFGLIFLKILLFVVTVITLLFILSTVAVYSRILCFRFTSPIYPGSVQTFQSRSKQETFRRKFRQDLEVAKSCLLLIVCCLVCYLPGLLSNTHRLTKKATFPSVVLRRWFSLLFLSNSFMNPLIFFWRNKALRIQGINLIKKICYR